MSERNHWKLVEQRVWIFDSAWREEYNTREEPQHVKELCDMQTPFGFVYLTLLHEFATVLEEYDALLVKRGFKGSQET